MHARRAPALAVVDCLPALAAAGGRQPAADALHTMQAPLVAGREPPLVAIRQPLIPRATGKNVPAWFSPVNTAHFDKVRMR